MPYRFPPPAPVRRRKRRSPWVVAVLLVLIVAYGAFALTRPLPTLSPTVLAASTTNPGVDISLPWPSYGEAAVGAAGYRVLATHGAQTARPTASIAKVVTALAVLQRKPLQQGEAGPTLTLTQADVDSYNKYVAEDGSVVAVANGEQISEYQALQAMLLPSANNMAETLARWAFGSIAAYNAYANSYVARLGLSTMHITDPSGFLPTTVASARDLTALGETAIQNPVLADIVAQSTATVPEAGEIHNVNHVLGMQGIVGIKTGNNDQDTGAFLFAATHQVDGQTVTIVGAVMDAPTLPTALRDSLPLVAATGQDFAHVTVVKAGDNFGSYNVPWQGKVNLIASKTVAITTWKGAALKSSVSAHALQAPAVKGQTAGTLVVQNGLDSRKSLVPLSLSQAIPRPGLWWRLTHAF